MFSNDLRRMALFCFNANSLCCEVGLYRRHSKQTESGSTCHLELTVTERRFLFFHQINLASVVLTSINYTFVFNVAIEIFFRSRVFQDHVDLLIGQPFTCMTKTSDSFVKMLSY